jgi:hypothetical protein
VTRALAALATLTPTAAVANIPSQIRRWRPSSMEDILRMPKKVTLQLISVLLLE